jgi:acetyl esterase/lipase
MSFTLRAISLYLRYVEKRKLAAFETPERPRVHFERTAARVFRMPRGTSTDLVTLETAATALNALWLTPRRAQEGRVLLFLHGGAFLLGSMNTHKHLAAAMAKRISARAFVPDYRLAPEDPFPAAPDDAIASYRYLLAEGFDPGSIVVAGDSAGGGLALVLLHDLARHGLPMPAATVTFSPWTDMTLSGETLRSNARWEALIPTQKIPQAAELYLNGASKRDPRASPIFGTFDGASPVCIQASRAEVLADDSVRMADVLSAHGVPVELNFWQRTPHVWQIFQGIVPEADEALDAAAAFLNSYLRPVSGDDAVA